MFGEGKAASGGLAFEYQGAPQAKDATPKKPDTRATGAPSDTFGTPLEHQLRQRGLLVLSIVPVPVCGRARGGCTLYWSIDTRRVPNVHVEPRRLARFGKRV